MQNEPLYQRILAYLKGILSDRQRHDLERDMMRDAFDEEAFEGLSMLSETELKTDMQKLGQRLQERITKKERSIPLWLKIAAGILFFGGIGSYLYVTMKTPSAPVVVAQNKSTGKDSNTLAVSPHVTDTMQLAMKEDQPKAGGIRTGAAKENARRSEYVEEKKEDIAANVPASEEITEIKAPDEPAVLSEKSAAAAEDKPPAVKRAVPSSPSVKGNVYSGKVLDETGEALPGVTIQEKGTTNGTVTDMNGNFTLSVKDTSSALDFSYVGYHTAELDPRKTSIDQVTLEPEVTALDEVVVVGYGTQQKSTITGAVSTIDMDEDKPSAAPEITKPVPPQNSMRDFKKWIYERIDFSSMKSLTGKQRVTVELMIYRDGSIGDIQFRNTVADDVAKEIQRVISQSPRWQPARQSNTPVDSKIIIRLVIE
jgi:hypothetical protein